MREYTRSAPRREQGKQEYTKAGTLLVAISLHKLYARKQAIHDSHFPALLFSCSSRCFCDWWSRMNGFH